MRRGITRARPGLGPVSRGGCCTHPPHCSRGTDTIAGSGSFTLDDGQTETNSNVMPGMYTVTEDDPTPGFDLTGLVCSDSDTGGTDSTEDVGKIGRAHV